MVFRELPGPVASMDTTLRLRTGRRREVMEKSAANLQRLLLCAGESFCLAGACLVGVCFAGACHAGDSAAGASVAGA
ncbi:MAG: hypothetical protein JXB36_13175, partial [Gammaproteobacteria bacterium]|nr:hypothetical protein [Gammaproteobacteria bacterium]